MNPFQAFTLALSGVLILLLVSNFLVEINYYNKLVIDELDLKNLINVYERGLIIKAGFNISFKPVNNGTLIINSETISLNKATINYQGLTEVNCNYDEVIISEEGFKCLKY